MADKPKFVFSVNVSKILAKLHLAGRTQAPNYLIGNTLVENDNLNSTPENPGKVEFIVKSGKAKGEVCLVVHDVTFKGQIDVNADLKAKALKEEMKKAKNDKSNATDEKKSAADKQKLTDDNSNVDKAQSEIDNADKEVSDVRKKYIARLKEIGLGKLKDESTDEEISQAIKDENAQREKDAQKAVEKAKKDMFKELVAYFTTFAGKDNAKKLDITKVVTTQMPTECNTPDDIPRNRTLTKFITGKIFTSLTPEQQNIWRKKSLEDQSKEFSINVGFTVGYELVVQ